jgi:hypothetical protein
LGNAAACSIYVTVSRQPLISIRFTSFRHRAVVQPAFLKREDDARVVD